MGAEHPERAAVSGRLGAFRKPSRPACASLNIVDYDVREPHSLGSTWRRQKNRTRSTRLARTSNRSSDCPRREPPKSRVRSKETGICPDRTRVSGETPAFRTKGQGPGNRALSSGKYDKSAADKPTANGDSCQIKEPAADLFVGRRCKPATRGRFRPR
jgi:hypothetical protein